MRLARLLPGVLSLHFCALEFQFELGLGIGAVVEFEFKESVRMGREGSKV